MPRFRFSLLGLLALVTLAAFGCAALRFSNDWWSCAAFSLCLCILLTASLRLWLARGERRAFLGGFALFGWAYLFAVFGPWTGAHVGPRLVTSKLIAVLEARVAPQNTVASVAFSPQGQVLAVSDGTVRLWDGTGAAVSGWQPTTYVSTGNGVFQATSSVSPGYFASTGHSLLSLIVAFGGGLTAMFFAGRKSGTPPAAEASPAGNV